MTTLPKTENGLLETLKTLIWALLIAGVFRTLFFQPFFIPSGSMKDTLLVGDFLFVNKMAYGYSRYSCPLGLCPFSGRILIPGISHAPERGDIVVFHHPWKDEDLIKRLVGLPGDRIQVKAGILYINGTAAPQVPDGTFTEVKAPQGGMGDMPACKNDPVPEGGACITDRAIETLPGGVAHDVLNITDAGFADNTDVYVVPQGMYFMMGDNRDNSEDSRFDPRIGGVGFVPAENLIGKANLVVFSSAGRSMFFFWTWRLDRFFHWAS